MSSPYSAIKHCEACYHGKDNPEIRLQARAEANRVLENYLASPQQGAWETSTRARVQGLQIACSECDGEYNHIGVGLKGLLKIHLSVHGEKEEYPKTESKPAEKPTDKE